MHGFAPAGQRSFNTKFGAVNQLRPNDTGDATSLKCEPAKQRTWAVSAASPSLNGMISMALNIFRASLLETGGALKKASFNACSEQFPTGFGCMCATVVTFCAASERNSADVTRNGHFLLSLVHSMEGFQID